MSYMRDVKHRLMWSSRKKKLDYFFNDICGGRWPTILDVGVADNEHSPFDNFLEKNCPCPENITALSIYPLEHFKMRYPAIKPVVYSGGKMPFEDKAFEVIHCNAVIEHVGGFEKQVDFIREIGRVGRKFFITTPSRYFPFETHTNLPFMHYLPKRQFDNMLKMIGKEWAAGDYMHLLTGGDLIRILRAAQVGDSQIFTKRFLGLPLHYYVVGGK